MSLKKLILSLRKNNSFLITTHKNMEGDALGSELAFCLLVEALGKKAVIINDDNIPGEYRFLPFLSKVKKLSRNIQGLDFDCFVTLDCSDLKRCGDVRKLITGNEILLNIDHHISNSMFADVNWVNPDASSASEMVFDLYKEMHVALDKNVATLLYVGILTDTGSFHYSNTGANTHLAVAELLKHDLDITAIYKKAYENIPFDDLKLLAKILLEIKRNKEGNLVWLAIPKAIANRDSAYDLSEYLLSFARAIKGVEVVVLFKENPGLKNEIRMNFRSQGKVDVNKLASLFGGGGHKTASGATAKGSLLGVMNKVLPKVRASISSR